MPAWEYLFLEVTGHNRPLRQAENMLVTSSDGRWADSKMPKDIIGIVNQLGAEGWEMINSSGGGDSNFIVTPSHYGFEAVFKRPKPQLTRGSSASTRR